jgi:hypothetical protein
VRGALFNRKPRGHGTGKNERSNKEEKKDGKVRQSFSWAHFFMPEQYIKYTLKL